MLLFFQLDRGRKGPLNRSHAERFCARYLRSHFSVQPSQATKSAGREGRQQLSTFLSLRFSNQDGAAAPLRRAARTKHCCSTG